MKTTVVKIKDMQRKWWLVDAKGKTLGHICTKIADKLRGKDKPIFSAHMDCGDFVIVINAEKVKLTGKKLTDKLYYRHTGYPGGLISPSAGEILASKNPTKIIELGVRGMLPKNNLRAVFMKKLKLYAGESHEHASQKPEVLEC